MNNDESEMRQGEGGMTAPADESNQTDASRSAVVQPLSVNQLQQRLGVYERQQILIWQQMSPVERLQIAFQAYQFALEAVRLTERQRHPDLSEQEFKWRVIRRMQGNQRLGRE